LVHVWLGLAGRSGPRLYGSGPRLYSSGPLLDRFFPDGRWRDSRADSRRRRRLFTSLPFYRQAHASLTAAKTK
jgi:hypothetical protein